MGSNQSDGVRLASSGRPCSIARPPIPAFPLGGKERGQRTQRPPSVCDPRLFPPPSRGRVREGMRLLIVRARVVRQQPCTSRPTGDLPNLLASSTEVATAPSRTQQTKSGPIDLRRRPTLGRQQAQRIAPSFFIRRNIDCALSGVSGVPNFSSQSSASALSL